jgi:4-amino-4-deoxy-L-arabinose transferase-like glycosyltransferase
MAAVLLVAAAGTVRQRVGRLAAGGAALLVSAGWWPLVVGLIPKADRPWVGSTTSDSPLGLAFGYNGLGRLAGEASPSGRGTVNGGSLLRLVGSAAGEASWLLPAALIALGAGLFLLRGRPRADPQRAALLLWGGWAVTTAAVFSVMRGIWHAYYTVELAPALAALVAIGATLLWRRGSRRALAVLAAGSLLTTVWAVALLSGHFLPGSRVGIVVAVVGVAAVVLLALRARDGGRRFATATVGLLVVAAVLGPATWSVVTVRGVHVGASVAAGPGARPGAASAVPVSAQALALLRRDSDDWTWTGAVVGHRAGAIQLATGAPVLPVGGFGGSDPAPTLDQFRADVAGHRVHWFIKGGRYGGDAGAIEAWVRTHAPSVRAGGTTLYDVGALAPGGSDDDDRRFGHT